MRQRRSPLLRPVASTIALLAAASIRLNAAPPTLDHLSPVAVQAGTTNSVMAIGKFDAWPLQVWVETPGITFQAETNKGRFTVIVATNAPVGPHLFRLFDENGASKPRFLIVAAEPQISDREPNDAFASPQQIGALPAFINGRLDKSGDVDSFAVNVSAGQTLIADIDAAVLGSPVDVLLRVLDARGIQVAWNHDEARTMDPFLAWTAQRAGTYIVQVMGFAYPATSEIRFHGGEACVYRLKLSTGPTLSHTRPLGVRRGTKTRLQLAGWNLDDAARCEFIFDAEKLPKDAQTAFVMVPEFASAIEVPVGDGAELDEAEAREALTPPFAVTGCLSQPGKRDRYTFSAGKGEKLQLEVRSAALGFPVDAWLRVEDSAGRELARNDDSGGPDPKLEWSAPSDGTFAAVIGNLLHRGGSNFFYRLTVSPPIPDFKAVINESTFTLKPGATNEIKVAVRLSGGFDRKLTLSARGLPDGVSANDAPVPEKGGEVTLKLAASTNAPPHSGTFRLLVRGDDIERAAVAELTSSTVDNGVPGGFRNLVIPATDQLWLTVPAKATSPTNAAAQK